MNVDGNGKKYPTWKWLAITLVTAILTIVGYAYAKHDTAITTLQEKKVDKEDLKQIQQQVNDIYKLLFAKECTQ